MFPLIGFRVQVNLSYSMGKHHTCVVVSRDSSIGCFDHLCEGEKLKKKSLLLLLGEALITSLGL